RGGGARRRVWRVVRADRTRAHAHRPPGGDGAAGRVRVEGGHRGQRGHVRGGWRGGGGGLSGPGGAAGPRRGFGRRGGGGGGGGAGRRRVFGDRGGRVDGADHGLDAAAIRASGRAGPEDRPADPADRRAGGRHDRDGADDPHRAAHLVPDRGAARGRGVRAGPVRRGGAAHRDRAGDGGRGARGGAGGGQQGGRRGGVAAVRRRDPAAGRPDRRRPGPPAGVSARLPDRDPGQRRAGRLRRGAVVLHDPRRRAA